MYLHHWNSGAASFNLLKSKEISNRNLEFENSFYLDIIYSEKGTALQMATRSGFVIYVTI